MKRNDTNKNSQEKSAKELTQDYLPPFFLFNSHLETIFPALLRRVALMGYTRERIATPDDDFLDLDWLAQDSDSLVIISHGLEGNSKRAYIKGMARALFNQGHDVIAWNFRGCSEDMNRQLRFYHSGATDDLHTVIRHAAKNEKYKWIFLVGFSLGGNVTLKYLGEQGAGCTIAGAVVFSVPMDLKSSCEKISLPGNRLYSQRFLRSLKKKILIKARQRNDLDISSLGSIRTLAEFDDCYTAPLHGFRDASDYYHKCSSIRFVSDIKIPTLVINTLNDPFLTDACFPVALLEHNKFVKLQVLPRGGHVGFAQFNKNGLYWSEQRAVEFLREVRDREIRV